MAETDQEYRLVEDKRKEMKDVFDRMDEDEKLYFLEPYEMKMLPPYDGKKMPDVANITLNDPLLYATKAIAIIGGATMQTIVEGRDLPDKKTTKTEEFLDDVFYMIDERLPKRKIPGLDAFINEQICIRGRIAARVCLWIDPERGLVADVLPLDTRYYVEETDGDDIVWGAAIFKRSKTQIEREYGDVKVAGSSAEVVDYRDLEKSIIFIDGQKARELENTYGHVPFVSGICPIGSMFATEDAMEHEGESIFWANRDLWEEKNRTATILQTLNINALFSGLQYESEQGTTAPKPQESPYGPRKVVPVDKGGGFKPIPVNDIKNATRLFYSVLENSLQKGSLSVIDYGTLTFPLSAIAITRLSASRDDVFLPRVQAKAMFYQQLSRMIINQAISLNKTLELGRDGSRNKYTKNDLDGDYSIRYRFFTESKEQTAADLSIANAAAGYLSGDTIRREILKLQDPDGEETRFLSEQAEKVDEVLFLYRRASKLIEDKKPMEAYILAQRIQTILEQRRAMGQLSDLEKKVQPGETEEGRPLMPLTAEGGRAIPHRSEPEEVENAEV